MPLKDQQRDEIARIIDQEAADHCDNAWKRRDGYSMMVWIGRLNSARAKADQIAAILAAPAPSHIALTATTSHKPPQQ